MGGAYEGDPPVWFGDVGYDPLHGANLGGVTPLRRPAPHGEAPTTPNVRGFLYPPPYGRCSEGGRYEVDYDVYCAEKEYGFAVHCCIADSGALIGCGGTARARVVKRWW